MIFPLITALLAIVIYSIFSFALYKIFLKRNNNYMRKIKWK